MQVSVAGVDRPTEVKVGIYVMSLDVDEKVKYNDFMFVSFVTEDLGLPA